MIGLFSHPGRSKLREWLVAPSPSASVTAHVETCERCATRLEDLAAKDSDGVAAATDNAILARTIKSSWAPRSDLTDRVIQGIDERRRNERDLDVMIGLLGIATEAATLMLADRTNPDSTIDTGNGRTTE